MKRSKFQIGVLGIILVSMLTAVPFVPVYAAAEPQQPIPGAPALFISQFKIGGTGNQFFEIYNNSGQEIDMAHIQLAYFNHYDMSQSSSNKLITMTGKLPAGGYYMVNDSALNICYQAQVANASLGLNNTNGLVQLLEFVPEEGRYVSSLLDSVAWNKAKVATMPHVVPTLADPSKSYRRNIPVSSTASAWSPMYFDAHCGLTVESASEEESSALTYTFLTGAYPPVRYVAAVSEQTRPVNRNQGKAAPIINEILPNPASPQTDADDEFIELYNPNDTVFDLSGFKLAFGSTNPRKYTFPEGTVMQPHEFKAFTSGDTSISLSNTEAQVWLLDPNEQIIGQSDPYVKAKDGQAWALNNGVWAWTAVPSPNAVNTFSGSGGGSGGPAAAVLGISASGGAATAASQLASAGNPEQLDDAAPLHPAVLAGVGLLALGYALYEYRHDISNKVFQFKRYVRLRKEAR